jgi:hypothetical protein
MNFLKKFLLLWVSFALLDPDPDPLTRLNPDPIRIRNPAPEEPPILYSCRESELVTLLKKVPGTYQWQTVKATDELVFRMRPDQKRFALENFLL